MKHIVAKGIRFEIDPATGKMYLIFEVIDNNYKEDIYKDWSKDEDLEIEGRNLIRKK